MRSAMAMTSRMALPYSRASSSSATWSAAALAEYERMRYARGGLENSIAEYTRIILEAEGARKTSRPDQPVECPG